MYAQFYGFRDLPFRITPDPRLIYRNPCYDEAAAALAYGIEQRKGFLSLVGEVGTGKTTLLRHLLERPPAGTRTILLLHPTVGFDEVLEYVLQELGVPTDGARKLALLHRLNDFLLEHTRAGGNVALLIDEAQDLDAVVLEELRLLSNLETGREKILQILLAGQPELERKLAQPALRQLRQRIAMHVRLRTLTRAEVGDYVRARLAAVGGSKDVFTSEALARIAEVSEGIPRVVNVLCDACLVTGVAAGTRQIGRAIVDEAWADYARLLLPDERPLASPAAVPRPAAEPTALPEEALRVERLRGPEPAPAPTADVPCPGESPPAEPPAAEIPPPGPTPPTEMPPRPAPPPATDRDPDADWFAPGARPRAPRRRRRRVVVAASTVVVAAGVGVYAVAAGLLPRPDVVLPAVLRAEPWRQTVARWSGLDDRTGAPDDHRPGEIVPGDRPSGELAPDAVGAGAPAGAADAASTPPNDLPTPEEARALVQTFRLAYEDRDVGRLIALFAADATDNERSGVERIAAAYREAFENIDDVRYSLEPADVVMADGRVVVRAPFLIRYAQPPNGQGEMRGTAAWEIVRREGRTQIVALRWQLAPRG